MSYSLPFPHHLSLLFAPSPSPRKTFRKQGDRNYTFKAIIWCLFNICISLISREFLHFENENRNIQRKNTSNLYQIYT